MLRVFVFIFKNALKSTWAIFFCFPATPFQQACRMKANLLHPPGIISIILQKMNLTNPTNPNILNKLSTLEWMKWASVEEDNSLLLKVEGGLPLATAVLLYLSLYQSSDQLLSCLEVFWPNHSWSSLLLLEPYPDFHGMLAAEEAVWSLSPISWPGGHRPSSCSPAPGEEQGLPQGTQDSSTSAACWEGSSGVLCPSLHCHYPCDTSLPSWPQQSGS